MNLDDTVVMVETANSFRLNPGSILDVLKVF
jgi:hypothetical protein